MKEESSITAFSHIKKEFSVALKRKLEKPLPLPFDLPQNYPAIVMSDLAKNMLSGKARTKFIATVASAIFRYKSYPTPEERRCVAMQIVQKYPFLKSSATGSVS